MALGDFTLIALERKFDGTFFRGLVFLYRRLFGMIDIHSHLRWQYLKSLLDFEFKDMIELGAGNCAMIAEVYRVFKKSGAANFVAVEPYGEVKKIKTSLVLDNLSDINIVKGKIEQIKQKDKSFDFVLLMDVLEHVDNPEIAMKEVSRITKKGGNLIISVPNPNYLKFFGKKFNEMIGHKRFYTKRILQNLVEKSGFRVISVASFTGLVASLACALWYRFVFYHFKLAFPLAPLFRLAFIGDFLFSKVISSHIILKAEKT
jgi:SAM-dependent methyltransferase